MVTVNVGDNCNAHFQSSIAGKASESSPGGSAFLSFNVCPEDRVHTRKVSPPIGLEPFHHIRVEAKMNGSFTSRHDYAGALPEVRTERFGFGRIRAGFVLAPFAPGSDLAKGMSHDGRFLFHLCSLCWALMMRMRFSPRQVKTTRHTSHRPCRAQ